MSMSIFMFFQFYYFLAPLVPRGYAPRGHSNLPPSPKSFSVSCPVFSFTTFSISNFFNSSVNLLYEGWAVLRARRDVIF